MKVTKKLRDVTKEEFIDWSRRNCAVLTCSKCPFDVVECGIASPNCWFNRKDLYSDKFLDRTIEVEGEEILNKEDKEYLSVVIKPFRDKVKYIIKYPCITNEQYYIRIVYGDYDTWGKDIGITMPPFKKDKMYKNMKLGKKYSLEELGL